MVVGTCFKDPAADYPLLTSLFCWPESPSSPVPPFQGLTILAEGKKESKKDGEHLVQVVLKSSSSSKKSRNQEDLDLTGSPLKVSFTLDEDEEEEFEVVSLGRLSKEPSYVPLATKFARKQISAGNVSKDPKTEVNFAICNNDDQTVFLGSSKNLDKNRLTLFKVLYIGHLQQSSIMDDAYAEHEAEGKTCVHARAVYNISDSAGIDEDMSSLKLLFKWPNPRQLREAPPVISTFVELQVRVCFSDDRIACYKMYGEIELLKGFKSGLDNQGLKLRKRQDDDPDLMEELRKLMNDVKQHGPRSMVQAQEKTVVTEDMELITAMDRQDVDLTDLLWGVLKKVESFAQLRQAWEFVFETIKQEEIRPYIYARNSTKVSKIIRAVVRGEDSGIHNFLEGSGPLEMLFEIGVEKLTRDYLFTVLNNYLATRDDLEAILQNNADCMLMLEKFHCIHSVICVCLAFLSPDQDCLRSIVQQAITTVSKVESVQRSTEFNISINGTHIKDKIASLCPSIWQCHFSSTSGLETTLHLSVDPPVDYIDVTVPTVVAGAEEDVDDIENVQYHILKATAITRAIKFSNGT